MNAYLVQVAEIQQGAVLSPYIWANLAPSSPKTFPHSVHCQRLSSFYFQGCLEVVRVLFHKFCLSRQSLGNNAVHFLRVVGTLFSQRFSGAHQNIVRSTQEMQAQGGF